MSTAQAAQRADRKRRGAWYTPTELIGVVLDGVLDGFEMGERRPVRVLDPACGDGRFLLAVAERLTSAGHDVALTGCDIDATALASIPDGAHPIERLHEDARSHAWHDRTFDLVVGNPPFLSQMASATTRGRSSRFGGGPYADVAAEFLALAVRLAHPGWGRVGLVLPQSILGSRDTADVRVDVSGQADLMWSWWSARQQHFDAAVNVCALGFRRPATGTTTPASWTQVVTDELDVPAVDQGLLRTDGMLADRAHLNANFRDEYYALVPAVSDDADGPPLVTTGLIDPGVCHWGRRPVRFAKQRFARPRVDLSALEGRFVGWAERKLVPKVLVASQTHVIEAVADPIGEWLPGVPVTSVTPIADASVWELAAVLTSPVASALAWQTSAGTGMSTRAVRIGPATLASIPWPAGPLDRAVDALRSGDIVECGTSVDDAYGLLPDDDGTATLLDWWIRNVSPDDPIEGPAAG